MGLREDNPSDTWGQVGRSRQGRGVLPAPPGVLEVGRRDQPVRLPRQAGPRPVGQPPAPHRIRLVDVVSRACLPFHDLPIDFALDLAASVDLDEATAGVVGSAIAALLTNVRQHAAARMVVIHADALVTDLEWEVTVCDDGRGFHSDSTPRGFGLAVQVDHALSVHHVSAMIAAAPGEGTTVIMRGPLIR